MAYQQFAVNANRRKPYQVDQMNARRALLPTMIANQNRKADIERADLIHKDQVAQWGRENSLANKVYRQQKRAGEIGTGVSALQSALTIGSNYGGPGAATVGSAADKLVSGFGGKELGSFTGSNVRLADIGTGLTAGYGISKLIGGGKKKKTVAKLAGGAGGGALVSALSGGNPITGAVSGLIGGGIGKFF